MSTTFDTSPRVPVRVPVVLRSRNRTGSWLPKLGLSTLLIVTLLVISFFYIGTLVNNEKSQIRFADSTSSVILDAPSFHDHQISTGNTMTHNVSNITTSDDNNTIPTTIVQSTQNPTEPNLTIDDNQDQGGRTEYLTFWKETRNDTEYQSNNHDIDHANQKRKNGSGLTEIVLLNTTISRSSTLFNQSNTTGSINSITNRTMVTVTPFQKQDNVVIVTKIHGSHQLHLLEQSLCLLHFAYNRRPQYDILVFTTDPVPDESISHIQQILYPINLTFVVDNRGLQQEIAALSQPRYEAFLEACNVTSPVNLTWWSECPGRIAYNWQAEFRAWHIWKHPALSKYRWMMWLDADAFCTKEWTIDPMQAMIENDLVILFDNWPKGLHAGKDVQKRIWKSFGVRLCSLRLRDGHFYSKVSNGTCKGSRVADIHGFFHITNLDFYRSDIVQKWAENWIGNGFLQRRYDDQAAVTIPAAILAPERAWEMRRNDIQLDVYHNFDLDGKRSDRVGGFKKYWKTTVVNQLPDAAKVCIIYAGN